ncbi:hypothetical protein VTP01DRAFT_3530 [Rhizomucor pusillus]|uniref:uncharacterized protein n=1 Tax=Rhizomucor pusillus TaxID=4840 RepID=UPI00374374F2
MTSDGWRSWTVALSPLMLKIRLSTQHRDKWMLFVKAARILCKPALTTSEARKAHLLLMEFCRGCVTVPTQQFWFRPDDRHHTPRIAGQPTSNKNCLSARFLATTANSSQWVDTCFDYFAFLQVTDLDAPNVDARPLATGSEPLPPSSYPVKTGKLVYMDPTHFQQLVSYYDSVDEEHYTYFGASDEHQGQTFISSMSRQYRSSTVISVVCRDGGHLEPMHDDPHDTSKKVLRPANVLYYFQRSLEGVEHVFAYVEYFQRSPLAWISFGGHPELKSRRVVFEGIRRKLFNSGWPPLQTSTSQFIDLT